MDKDFYYIEDEMNILKKFLPCRVQIFFLANVFTAQFYVVLCDKRCFVQKILGAQILSHTISEVTYENVENRGRKKCRKLKTALNSIMPKLKNAFTPKCRK